MVVLNEILSTTVVNCVYHAMKAQRERGSRVPRFTDPGTWGIWVLYFGLGPLCPLGESHLYTWDRRLGGSRWGYWCSGKKKSPNSFGHRSPTVQSVARYMQPSFLGSYFVMQVTFVREPALRNDTILLQCICSAIFVSFLVRTLNNNNWDNPDEIYQSGGARMR
jgi:hypothetical protein